MCFFSEGLKKRKKRFLTKVDFFGEIFFRLLFRFLEIRFDFGTEARKPRMMYFSIRHRYTLTSAL